MKTNVKGIKCPVCGDNLYDKEYLSKDLYLCCHHLYNMDGGIFGKLEVSCCHCQPFCKTCKKLYDETDFEKHSDVWTCKKCETIHWGYTEYMRKKEGIISVTQNMKNKSKKLDEISKKFNL